MAHRLRTAAIGYPTSWKGKAGEKMKRLKSMAVLQPPREGKADESIQHLFSLQASYTCKVQKYEAGKPGCSNHMVLKEKDWKEL